MEIRIKEVINKGDLRKFIHFPFKIYKKNKCWIPPLLIGEWDTLSEKKNPAFKHCQVKMFLAYKNNEIAGRIAGIINKKYIEKWGSKYCRFGWFDFIDDEEVFDSTKDFDQIKADIERRIEEFIKLSLEGDLHPGNCIESYKKFTIDNLQKLTKWLES